MTLPADEPAPPPAAPPEPPASPEPPAARELPAPPELPPPLARPDPSARWWRRMRPEVAALVVVLSVSLLVLGGLAVHNADRKPGAPSAPGWTTVTLADGRTGVVDAQDGFSLTLPTGWRPIALDPAAVRRWESSGPGRDLASRLVLGDGELSAAAGGVLFAAYAQDPGTGRLRGMVAVTTVPQGVTTDPFSADELRRELALNPALTDIEVTRESLRRGEVLHARVRVPAAGTSPATVPAAVMHFYLVPGSSRGGFAVVFGENGSGTPADVQDVAASFDPEYPG